MQETDKGMIYLYTGNGKGKTSAAMGQILRALGHGWRCAVIQYIKANRSGELTALEYFGDQVAIAVAGAGFTWQGDESVHRESARLAWEKTKDAITSARYRLVLLDELTYPLNLGYLDEGDVIGFLRTRPLSVHVIITGRDASEQLRDTADLVSVIDAEKHYFDRGVAAVEGIDF